MLPRVAFGPHCCSQSTQVENYRSLMGNDVIDEILQLSKELKGLRVCQVNATASGGVAELLVRQVPLYQSLGLQVDWRIIHGDEEFFEVTKGFHNALQGADFRITSTISEEYLEHNRLSAEMLDGAYDVYMVHDPQPAALRYFFKNPAESKWIWRCHIDSSTPSQEAWNFLRPYIEKYDAAVFTMREFVPPDLQAKTLAFIPPAIDPLATKNMELPQELCRQVIADYGLDLNRPILLQVARFDPWKDPLGVIEAYRLVREKHPGVQLVLIGAMAGDDPEGWAILEKIQKESTGDPDISVFTNMTGVGNMDVNAFQRGVDLIIQKSLKEGFGLVVSEALWKEKPIVAGAAGGIPMQFPEGYEKYLVQSVEECAEQLLVLLENPQLAADFGRAGKEKVRREFLLPRLIRDELRLIHDLLKQ